MSLMQTIRQIWRTYQVLLTQTTVVVDTLYDVLDASGGIRLCYLEVRQNNTGTTDEEIDVLITQDGVAWLYDASAVGVFLHNIKYGIKALPYNVDQAINDLDIVNIAGGDIMRLFANGSDNEGWTIEGDEILVQVRQTSGVGAGQRIMAKLTYQVLEVL